MESVGMHHPQGPYLYLQAGFLSNLSQDAIKHSFDCPVNGHRASTCARAASAWGSQGECPQVGIAPDEPGTGLHGGEEELTEALAAPRPVEGRHGLSEAVDRPRIVALRSIRYAQGLVRHGVQDDIPAGRGEREAALGGDDGLVKHAPALEMDRQKAADPPQPTRVVEAHCEGLGLAQTRQDTPCVARRQER